MKYKLQIEKLKQITMESVNKYCDKREELIVNQIINEAVWREYGQTLGTLLGEQELISNTFVRDLVKKICGSALRHSEEVLIEKLNQRQRTINDLSAELTDRDNLVETLNNSLKVRNDEAEQQDKIIKSLLIDKEELERFIEIRRKRELRLEEILAPHQELTQWIEEEMTCEPNSDKFEVSHDFLESLFYKVVQINH